MRRLLERSGHLVLWHGGSWMLTWHAPWCRSCEQPSAGWRLARSEGYLAGFGFELSYATPEERTA